MLSLNQRIHDRLYIANCDGRPGHRCITGFEIEELPELLEAHGYDEQVVEGIPQHYCPECRASRLLGVQILTE